MNFGEQLYGEQTVRALENVPPRGRRLGDLPELVRAYGLVKMAAARANAELGVLDRDRARFIERAAAELADQRLSASLVTPLVQGGGGTSTNMNVNEVLAARASQLAAVEGRTLVVSAYDHVNASQSTNDTYPTAMALALVAQAGPALTSLVRLRDAFRVLAQRWGHLQRLGRTCLQDAVPLTVGQTHRAHAAGVDRVREGVLAALRPLAAVPLGGTVLGTGIGAPVGFAPLAVQHLAALTGRALTSAEDPFDAVQHLDPYAALAGACARAAGLLAKVAADLRWLSSGPRGGLGEVSLPELQAGSSIMPGKVNPVVPELVMQLSFRVRGCAHTVDLAVGAGELELNVMEPVVLDALTTCLEDLHDAADLFARRCVSGLTWDSEGLRRNLAGSLGGYVELAGQQGYAAAEAARRAAPPG